MQLSLAKLNSQGMQLARHVSSRNQYWGSLHGILGQTVLEKEHLPSEKIWAFKYFCQKLAGRKVWLSKRAAPVN